MDIVNNHAFGKVRHFCLNLCLYLFLAGVVHPNILQADVSIPEDIEAVSLQIQDEPDEPGLYLRRANLYRLYGHWDEAVTDFQQAAHLDPGSPEVDFGLGQTYFDWGLFEEAIFYLNRAIARHPCHVRGLATRARSNRFRNQPLLAAGDYQRAIDCLEEPNNPLPEYYFERARSLESAGTDHIGAAIETLDQGINRLGRVWILEDYASKLERKRQNYVAALLRIDRLMDQSPRKEALLMRRSDILREAGRVAEAEADLAAARSAIEALPAERRRTRSMRQLESEIDTRVDAMKSIRDGQ